MKHQTTISILFCLLVITFGFMACDDESVSYTFPHKPHVEEEISCDTCHELGEDLVTLPTFDACLTCHDADDEVFTDCNSCHEKSNVKMTEESVVSHQALFKPFLSSAWHDVKFNHAEHVEADDETCLSCHSNIKESEHSSVSNLPTMDAAMKFNKENGISNKCSTCHLEVNTITAPASHDTAWIRKHGKMEEFTDKSRCLMCHEEATCTTCHQTQKPKDHTNLWRRTTHGIQASFDRSRCLVCHRSDECSSCHLSAASPIPPTSFHNPAAQCLACHAPQPNHRTPNRFLKPMPHRMMMGASSAKCLQCHQF